MNTILPVSPPILTSIPTEIILKCASFIQSPKDLLAFGQTSSHLFVIANEYLWSNVSLSLPQVTDLFELDTQRRAMYLPHIRRLRVVLSELVVDRAETDAWMAGLRECGKREWRKVHELLGTYRNIHTLDLTSCTSAGTFISIASDALDSTAPFANIKVLHLTATGIHSGSLLAVPHIFHYLRELHVSRRIQITYGDWVRRDVGNPLGPSPSSSVSWRSAICLVANSLPQLHTLHIRYEVPYGISFQRHILRDLQFFSRIRTISSLHFHGFDDPSLLRTLGMKFGLFIKNAENSILKCLRVSGSESGESVVVWECTSDA